jgi:ATP-binding cassette, subfamily F, member 3
MIQLNSLSLSFGSRELFTDINCVVNRGEKIALLGRNGFGKSSLLKIISGDLQPTSGDVIIPKDYSIGYLSQIIKPTAKSVLAEACLKLDAETVLSYEYQAKRLLIGLGFTESNFNDDPNSLSGGFQLRLELAKQLIAKPNLLLLDEPTNYLDILSIRWLSAELKAMSSEMIIISHDRSFLEVVCNSAMIIRRKKLKKVNSTIANLLKSVAEEEENITKAYNAEQERKAEILTFVNRFRAQASKATLVQSRIKELEKLNSSPLEKDEDTLDFNFNYYKIYAKQLLELKNASFSYDGERLIFKDFSLSLTHGDRVGIVGPNGFGKSTLLRVLAGALDLKDNGSSGELNISKNCKIGLFSQTNIAELNDNDTIVDTIEAVDTSLDKTRVRSICGAMLFSGDAALKKIALLSGGERSRVLLGKIVALPTNLLFLDEPTSHLDMESIAALAKAVKSFPGTTVTVSHDETFLKDLNLNKIIYFLPTNQNPELYLGNYEEFIGQIGWSDELENSTKTQEKYLKGSGKGDYKNKKILSRLERSFDKLSKEKEEIEDKIVKASANGHYQDLKQLYSQNKSIEQKLAEVLKEIDVLTEA